MGLLMELMATSLDNVLQNGHPLTGPEKKHIALSVAQGMKYLHSSYKSLENGQEQVYKRAVLHRDLKAENVLLSLDRKTVKIADFGLGRTLESWESAHSIVGTPFIRAPEIIRASQVSQEDEEEEEEDDGDDNDDEEAENRRERKKGFGAAADVFSYGMLLYTLLTGGLIPFQNPGGNGFAKGPAIFKKILRGERPSLKYIPNREEDEEKVLVLVMQLCWQQEAHHRPSMTKLVHWLSPSSSAPSLSLIETLQRELTKINPRQYIF